MREESGVEFVQEGNHRNRYYAIIGIQADGLPYNHAWQGCVSHLPGALPQAMFYDPFRVWCKNLFIYTLLIKGKGQSGDLSTQPAIPVEASVLDGFRDVI